MSYYTGHGYGVSKSVDVSGTPLLSWTNNSTGKTITLFDRVAVSIDPTLKSPTSIDAIYNARIDVATSSAIKQAIGGTSAQELDHKISLELGGSNQLANLGLDQNTPGTTNNPTDTFENQLSAAVQAGSMSLLDAWRAIATAKGFVLAEDIKEQSNNAFASAAASVVGVVENLIHTSGIKNIDQNLKAQIQQDHDTLADMPNNLALREKIFTEQINLTSQQLNLSKADAAAYLKVYTAKYATAKGQSPSEILGSFTANEQKLIGLASATPNVLSIPNTVFTNVAAACMIGAEIATTLGVLALIIAMLAAGPAEVAAAITGIGLSSIAGGFGLSVAAGITATLAFVAEVLGGLALLIPMITKQMLDATTIVPTMIATALNDDVKNIKALGGGGNTKSASTSSPTTSYATSVVPAKTQVFTGVVSSGVLGAGLSFTPQVAGIISSMAQLDTAAHNNLAPYLAALPSKLIYDIKITPHIINANGITQRGTSQRIVKGHTKKGVPEYKTVTNKFAVLDIYVLTDKGQRTRISTINLGPTDSSALNPSAGDLTALSGVIQGTISTSNTDKITTVVSNTPTGAITPAQVVVPAGTVTAGAVVATQTGTQSGIDAGTLKFYASLPNGNTSNILNTQWTKTNGSWTRNSDGAILNTSTGVITTPTQTTAPATVKPGASATTLYDWYTANGKTLPTSPNLAALYNYYALGPANLYVGSAEQNTQLLAAIKSHQ